MLARPRHTLTGLQQGRQQPQSGPPRTCTRPKVPPLSLNHKQPLSIQPSYYIHSSSPLANPQYLPSSTHIPHSLPIAAMHFSRNGVVPRMQATCMETPGSVVDVNGRVFPAEPCSSVCDAPFNMAPF